MPEELPVKSGWQQQVVLTRDWDGSLFLLARIRKLTCDFCGYGIRFETTWCSTRGEVNEIVWCNRCFNAEMHPREMDDSLRARWIVLMRRLPERSEEHAWSCIRPAIEDLERRGLL